MASKISEDTQQSNENQNFKLITQRKRSSFESNKSILESVKTDENEDNQTISDKNICDISNDTLKYIFIENEISTTKDSSSEKEISHFTPYSTIGWNLYYDKYSPKNIFFYYNNLNPEYNCCVFGENEKTKNGQSYFGKNKNIEKLNENLIFNFYTSTENYFKELSPDKNNYKKTKNFKPKEKIESQKYNTIKNNTNNIINNTKPLLFNYNYNYNQSFTKYDKSKQNKFDNKIDTVKNYYSNTPYYNNKNYYYDNYNNSNNNTYYYPKKKGKFVERNGDWVCSNCKNLNFAFRKECNRCKTRKDENKDNKDKENKENKDNKEDKEIKENKVNKEIKENNENKVNKENKENKEKKENCSKKIEKVQNDDQLKIKKKDIKEEINEFLPVKKGKNKKRKNKLKNITK